MILFIFMTLNSSLLLLLRSFGIGMLFLTKVRFFVYYWFGDMMFYLLQKAARDDFFYWLPLGEGAVANFTSSLCMRVVVKSLGDYTGIVQFRAPAELGGIYYSLSLLQGIIVSFVVVKMYFYNNGGIIIDEGGAEGTSGHGEAVENDHNFNFTDSTVLDAAAIGLTEDSVMRVVGLLSLAWIASFAAMLRLMKREYLWTFVSFETGREWAMSFYLFGETDKVRSKTLKLNRMKWLAIEDKVKAWVQANWWEWKEARPKWFTDSLIAKIPDDFIPNDEDRTVLADIKRRGSINVFHTIVGGVSVGAIIAPAVDGDGDTRGDSDSDGESDGDSEENF